MIRSSFVLALCVALLAGACGPADEAPVSDAERRMGAEQHPQLLAEFGGAYEGDEAAYLEATGEKLAAAAGLDGQCTFTLVNSDVVNAFAVPGCYIYVTRGMMGIVNSEAELASVLAHELGHISGNHVEQQQRRSILRSLGVLAVAAVTESERLTRLAGVAAGYFTLRFSRGHEYEADDAGLAYLRSAGYDPFAATDMLAGLARNEQFLSRTRERDEARGIPEWALTHPLTENRIARAKAKAAEFGAEPDALPEHEAAYLRTVDGLLYGDDPEQGFVTGRRFAHPVMRIAFEAPPGFTLTNSPQAILIEGPDGVRGEFAGGRLPPEGLETYAAAIFASLLRGAPAELGGMQRLTISGVPAVVASAAVSTPEGLVGLHLAAYDAGGGSAYHFLLVSPPSTAPQASFEALFRSFRLMSAAEAASLRPRRIRVARIGASDTLQSLAARMAAEHPADHFLMLNGRTAADPLRPGDTVKLVVLAPR